MLIFPWGIIKNRYMSFLNAEWRKLAIANYEVDPKILSRFVPFGTDLDLWKGKCYLSLVGFMFQNTQLMGVKVPWHINFEEVNLRFYVKRMDKGDTKRGVVFIKEIVPKPALSFVANTVYNEHYETLPMHHKWEEIAHSRIVEYAWKKGGSWHKIRIEADLEQTEITKGSKTEFITEHYWGYAKVNRRVTNEYEVTHPRWFAYPVQSFIVDVDFGLVYGAEFAFLDYEQPQSVMLAEGSEITVENKVRISKAN
jgi:uncharacterized protein YqjF (DUF2071 family)